MTMRRSYMMILATVAVLVAVPRAMALGFHSTPKAAVTFTFDDGNRTIFNNGFPVLAESNIPATLYMKTDCLEEDDPWCVSWTTLDILKSNHWEIGAHTHSHRDLTQLSPDDLVYELDHPLKMLAEHGIKATAFASPFGEYDDDVVVQVRQRYGSHRRAWGEHDGLNDPAHLDRYAIEVLAVKNTTTAEEVNELVDRAVLEHKWLVLMFHQVVTEQPEEYQVHFTMLQEVARHVAECRDQKLLTVPTVSQYLAHIH